MSNFEINDEYMEKIRGQFEKWCDFLNIGFGLVSFTLALTCLGTKTPVVNAWLCIVVVTYIRIKGSNIFPPEILALRIAAKTDQNARVLYNGLSKEFMGLKTVILHYPVFLLGFVLLLVIALSPAIATIIPALNTYVGS